MRESLAALAREHHLNRNIVVIQQPAQHVDLVDQGVGDRHIRGVSFTNGRVAVRTVQHQRFADLPTGQHLLQCSVALIVRAHKAYLHQAFAVFGLCLNDVFTALRSDRQRLLAEYRLAGGNRRQHELFMARAPGGHQHRLNVRGLDQIVAIVIHLGVQLQVAHHLGGVVTIDIVDRHDAAALQHFAAATNVIPTYCAGTNNPNVQCHFRYPLQIVAADARSGSSSNVLISSRVPCRCSLAACGPRRQFFRCRPPEHRPRATS
ncbi:hypothetical protein D3C78_1035650 [compost metagenome]